MFSVEVLGEMGLGQCWQILVESSGAQFWVSFSQRAQFGVSVTWKTPPAHPKVLQVSFVLVKIPPSAQTLLRKGGKSSELVQPLLLRCCFYPVPAGHGSPSKWVTGFCSPACSQSQFCRGFHSPASLGTQMCCCAWTAAWACKMVWKGK